MTIHPLRAGFFIFCVLTIIPIHFCFADPLINQTVNQVLNPEDQKTQPSVVIEEPKVEVFEFDLKNFSGERVSLNREYSNQIKNIQINLTFPPRCSFSKETPSVVNIFTAEQKLIVKADILGLKTRILLGQTIESRRLYVHAMLNYFCAGDDDVVKSILFDAPLSNYPKAEDVKIQYNLNNS